MKNFLNVLLPALLFLASGCNPGEPCLACREEPRLRRLELTLSLYFKNPGGAAVDFYYDNTRIVPEEFGDYLKVKITGINADQLSGDYTVKVDDGCVRYSPMNYCKAVLEGDYGDDLKNVVKALYAYSQAVEAYFKQM